MADSKIGTQLEVKGAAGFKKSITDAGKSIKAMGNELKLAAAQYKADGDAQKLLETRSKTLRAEIEKQTQVIKTTEDALQHAKEAYGEDSVQVDEWKGKLAQAKTALLEMQAELRNNEQGLDAHGNALVELGDSADSAAGKVGGLADAMGSADSSSGQFKFLDFNQALQNVINSTENAINKLKSFAKTAWNMAVESGSWADDLVTTAQQYNMTVEQLQGWNYASLFVDTDVDKIIRGIDTVRKKINGSAEDLKLFNPLVATSANGKARDADAVFWDTINALHNMEDAQKRITKAQEIFGNSYKDLLPLINAGKDAWDGYVQEAQDAGYVLGDGQVEALGEFDDSIQRMNAAMEAAKNTISAELAPAAKTISDAFTTLIDKGIEWANSEQGQQALGDLSEAISAVVTSFTDHTDFEGLVTGATGAIKSFGEALGWVKDNPDLVVSGVVGSLLTLKGLEIGQTVISLVTSLKGLSALKQIAASSTSEIAGAVGGLKGTTISSSVLSFLGKIMGAGGGTVGTTLILAGAMAGIAKSLNDMAEERDFGWTEDLTNMSAGISDDGVNAIAEGVKSGITKGIKDAKIEETIGSEVAQEYAKEAYKAVISGKSSDDYNVGLAIAYADIAHEEEISSAQAEVAAANAALNAVRNAGEDAAEAERRLAEARQVLTEATQSRDDDLMAIADTMATGNDINEEKVNTFNREIERAAAIYKAYMWVGGKLERDAFLAEEDGSLVLGENGEPVWVDELRQLLEQTGLQYENNPALINELNEAFKESIQSLDTMVGDNGPLLGMWQAMLDNIDTDSLDTKNVSGALLAAIRTQMLMDASGEDSILTFEELEKLFDSSDFQEVGANCAIGTADGIKDKADEAEDAAKDMAEDTTDAAKQAFQEKSPSKVFHGIGEFVAVGLANGIYDKANEAIEAARWMAEQVAAMVQTALDIHSPSKVMHQLGSFAAQGFAEGVEDSLWQVERATGGMVAQTINGAASAKSGSNLSAYIVMDKEVVGRMVAPVVDGYMGAAIAAER